MNRSPILNLPVECVDALALEIDSAKALLSLALTSKSIFGLVFYRHLQFRVICCRLEDKKSIATWDLLRNDCSLARSVRVLDIQPLSPADSRFRTPLLYAGDNIADKNPPLCPEAALAAVRNRSKRTDWTLSSWGPHEHVGERARHDALVRNYFAPAFRNMELLTTFKWKTPYFDLGEDEANLLFAALSEQRHLRMLDISVNTSGKAAHECLLKTLRFDRLCLRELRLDLMTRTVGSVLHADLFRDSIARDIPTLESLCMVGVWEVTLDHQGTINKFLAEARFPCLKTVEIRAVIMDEAPLFTFLQNHPTIESLTLQQNTTPVSPGFVPSLPPGILPNVKELAFEGEVVFSFLLATSSKSISHITIYWDYWGGGLEHTEEQWVLLQAQPLLRSLSHLQWSPWRDRTFEDKSLPDSVAENIVKRLPSLTEINGLVYDGDVEAFIKRMNQGVDFWKAEDDDLIIGSIFN